MTGWQLLRLIRRYCEQTGMAPSSFGRRAVNDPRLVADLRNGRQPQQRARARVVAYVNGEAC